MAIHERTFWYVAPEKMMDNSGEWESGDTERVMVPRDEANLVSSRLVNDKHAPAIDIDLPCELIESSTPGHFHLFIEKEMSWEQYEAILIALTNAGVVEAGYLSASQARQQTFLRRPGVTK